MANLQDIINLAKADGGKFFVMDESGDIKLVIMGVDNYQELMVEKLARKMQQQVQDIETINREILKAQLQEQENFTPTIETLKPTRRPAGSGPKIEQQSSMLRQDLRAEVIDPSFDFEGPKVEIDDL